MKKILLLLLLAACCLSVAAVAQRRGKSSAAANVTISNFRFTPRTVTIKAGGTVTWTNKEGAHTVTADDNSWESPTLNAGQTFSRKFDKPGNYPYHCSFHGGPRSEMFGVVKVVR